MLKAFCGTQSLAVSKQNILLTTAKRQPQHSVQLHFNNADNNTGT